MKRFILPLLFCVALFPAIWGLLRPGLFVSDDGGWMVIRFSAFYDAIRHGQFPVRFLPRLNHGYGYPVADFLYPLFLYLGVPIKLIRVGFVDTVKILFGVGMILSGICTYFWLRRIFGKVAAFSGAIVYVLFPYHIWDMYARGSIGEILALALVSYILWQIESRHWALSVLGIGFLVIAHNSLSLLFLPLIFLYILLGRIYSFKRTVVLFLAGLGLAAFFWIPALYDKQFTVFDKTPVADPISYLRWHYVWELLGVVSLLAFLCIVWHLFRRARDKKLFLFSLIFLAVLLLTLPVSEIIWRVLPGKQFIQFPFRLYALSIPAVAYILAKTVEQLGKKVPFMTIILVISYISCFPFLFPQKYILQSDAYYATNEDTTTVRNEYMPIWAVKTPAVVPLRETMAGKQNEQIIKGQGKIENDMTKGTYVTFAVTAMTASILQINFVYFPGWHVYIDGKQTAINYTNSQGLMQFFVPAGRHVVIAKFGETYFNLICDTISLVSLFVILIISFL